MRDPCCDMVLIMKLNDSFEQTVRVAQRNGATATLMSVKRPGATHAPLLSSVISGVFIPITMHSPYRP